MDGLGFLKNGFIYSINWADYWTKRWICFFLQFGLGPFCCDDPKQECDKDTEAFTNQMNKPIQIIFLGFVSLIKIIVYAILNLIYLGPLLAGVSAMSGVNGAWRSINDFDNFCYTFFDNTMKNIPKLPWGLESVGKSISTFIRTIEIWVRIIFCIMYFFMVIPMYSVFNYCRVLFFMLSGDGCGCNIFSKWEKPSNKIILTRIGIPLLIWTAIMFSLFIFSQISMVRGITSPQITDDPKNDFVQTLHYYFMKHDIDTLKYTNMNRENNVADKWYDTVSLFHSYETNLKELKNGWKTSGGKEQLMIQSDTSYHLNRLPEVLAALKKDLLPENDGGGTKRSAVSVITKRSAGRGRWRASKRHKKGMKVTDMFTRATRPTHNLEYRKKKYPNLNTLSEKFKYNQTVLSNMLEHIYGEGLDSVYNELKAMNERYFKVFTGETQQWGWCYQSLDPDSSNNFSPTTIHLRLDYLIKKQKARRSSGDTNLKNIADLAHEKLEEEEKDTPDTYKNNLLKIMNKLGYPLYIGKKTSTNDGSIGNLFAKSYEAFVKLRNIPFNLLDKILQSNILDLPAKIIEVAFSDTVLDSLFSFPMLLINVPFMFFNAFLSLF